MSDSKMLNCLMFLLLFLAATVFSAHAEDEIVEGQDTPTLDDSEPGDLTVVAEYDPALSQTPEGLAFDQKGKTLFVSSALTGEIFSQSINKNTGEPTGDPQVLAAFDIGIPLSFCNGFIPIIGEIDYSKGEVFVGINSCGSDPSGIYSVKKNGKKKLVALLPEGSLANGLKVRKGFVYVADTAQGQILRAPTNGCYDEAEIWFADESLEQVPHPFDAPGVNGLQLTHDSIIVSNPSQDNLVEIYFENGLPWAEAEDFYIRELDLPSGLDDFAIDEYGIIYGTNDPAQQLIEILPDDSYTILLYGYEEGQLLDGPTAAEFHPNVPGLLFITNAQFPFFPSTGNGPSVVSYQVF